MLSLADIRVAYDGRAVLAIDRLDLRPGDFTVVLGHNGSGKSTLFRVLVRELQPDAGEVHLDGDPLRIWRQRALARRIAHLPQRLPEVPGLTVRELCALGRFPWRGSFGRWRPEDEVAVERGLAETSMAEFADRLADELSGGERQRAWIAMLLAQESPTLLLDEPISALDPAHQIEILSLLERLNAERGRDVVAILHDVNLAARFASRIIALKGGRVVFDGSPAELMEESRLTSLYGTGIELLPRPGHLPVAILSEKAP